MGKYPTEITAAVLAKNAHISDETIRRDIADTEAEVANFTALLEVEQAASINLPDPHARRMAAFRAGARPSQIEERREFIAFLKAILAARAAGLECERCEGCGAEGVRTRPTADDVMVCDGCWEATPVVEVEVPRG